MSAPNHLKNITVVGGSGGIGRRIVSELAAAHFNVTVVTRSSSSTTPFAAGVKTASGDYESPDFWISTLRGQDAVVNTLGFTTPQELHIRIADAAIDAGVAWIVPCEFGSDSDSQHPESLATPVVAMKQQLRKHIDARASKSSWIGIVSNPWTDFSLAAGAFGIDLKNRTATLYDGGDTKFRTTSQPAVGRAVAAVLSLPVTSEGGKPALSDYKNDFVWLHSFFVSQRDLLQAVQRVTGTTDADWKIEHKSNQGWIDEGLEKVKTGDFSGLLNVIYGLVFKKDVNADYHGKPLAKDVLNLPDESLDDVVKDALQRVEA